MSFFNLSRSSWFSLVTFSLSLLNLTSSASSTTPPKKCGRLNSCDRVISYSIFQRGTCGRMARCYWELSHLESNLEGDSSNKAEYEEKIKEALCLIPTLGAYNDVREKFDDKTLEKYYPCGANDTQFEFYPMPTFYTFKGNDGQRGQLRPVNYLLRMGNCSYWEERCNKKLQEKIDKLCDLLNKNALKKLENKFQMKLRKQKFYQLAVLHPDIVEKEGIPFASTLSQKHSSRRFNNCSLLQFRRVRFEDGDEGDDSDGVPTFRDGYGFNSLDARIRGPYFDFYLLYEADPLGNFKNVAEADRWWNETKAYQELAHYLPTDMLEDIHEAIKCVYDNVNSPNLVWKPEKFCWGYSTFICVEKAMIKGNTCQGTVNTEERHSAAEAYERVPGS